jgi:hypothetical protein
MVYSYSLANEYRYLVPWYLVRHGTNGTNVVRTDCTNYVTTPLATFALQYTGTYMCTYTYTSGT